jgi:hypothetical protein
MMRTDLELANDFAPTDDILTLALGLPASDCVRKIVG